MMTTVDNILPYATTVYLPTSWHARLSFWTGVICLPLLIALASMRWVDRVEYLPMNKTGVLLLCVQTFIWSFCPVSAFVYGISAVIRIWSSRSKPFGTELALGGITLGFTNFFLAAILLQ